MLMNIIIKLLENKSEEKQKSLKQPLKIDGDIDKNDRL